MSFTGISSPYEEPESPELRIESGSRSLEDCVDQVMSFVAPKMIGGKFAPTPVGGDGKPFMAEAWPFGDMYWRASGEDLLIGAFRV